jgi:hypothetical protein
LTGLRSETADVVRATNNLIEINFTSAVTYATEMRDRYPYVVPVDDDPVEMGGTKQRPHGCFAGSQSARWRVSVRVGAVSAVMNVRNFIRKEQCSFAWDWGPGFVPAGIWQPIGALISSARATTGRSG